MNIDKVLGKGISEEFKNVKIEIKGCIYDDEGDEKEKTWFKVLKIEFENMELQYVDEIGNCEWTKFEYSDLKIVVE